MNRRYWIFLILIVVFIIALILISVSGNARDENVQEQPAPDITPTRTPAPVQEEADRPEPVTRSAETSADITGAQHFTTCAFRTGGNATIGVPAVVVLEGGLVLEPGDEIAIFTADGEICSGAAVWTGSNIAITAWGDDDQSEEADGLQEGEELLFRIWNQSTGEEVEVSTVSYEMGDGKYTADGIYVVSVFSLN